MKIKSLGQHCGECDITEYCGNPFGFCVCTDKRFSEMEESEYKKIAESATDIRSLEVCNGCTRGECGSYAHTEDSNSESCEHADETTDFYCKQIAAFVEKQK